MPLAEYVTVIESDPNESPACCHGPALLFNRVGKYFFACSACRSRKLCPLYFEVDLKKKFKTWHEVREQYIPKAEHHDPPHVLKDSLFCSQCCRIYTTSQNACLHHSLRGISPTEMNTPSSYLAQLSTNKGHAQYHFDKNTLDFMVRLASKFEKVLCLGTPSIFERLRVLGVKCHLADIDRRLEAFYSSRSFTWFNMFNGLAFRDGDESALWKFVNGSEEKPYKTITPERDVAERERHFSAQQSTLFDSGESLRTSRTTKMPSLIGSSQTERPLRKRRRRDKMVVCASMPLQIAGTDSAAEQFICIAGEQDQEETGDPEAMRKELYRNQVLKHSSELLHKKSVRQIHNTDYCEERFDSALVIIDPPFGALLGALAKTLKKLTNHGNWNRLLVFPYFNESQVNLHLPSLAMCDLAVRYRNQRKMKNDSSPVRIFTDIPLNEIPLPGPTYKYCIKCVRWVHSVNVHCAECGTCPSKNHAATRHCFVCQRCVKQTWDHCIKCKRCHLSGKCNFYRRSKGSATSSTNTVSLVRKSARRQKKR